MIIFSNVSWLLYYLFIFEKIFIHVGVGWCLIIHIATTYFTLTTYFWMLCEGAYLQLLLLDAFHDDKKRVKGLLVVGWLVPIMIVVPHYAFFFEIIDNQQCWSQFGNTNLFLAIPVIIIILLNILFLSNVIKMLRSKLTADASTQPLNARRNTSHRINSANMKQAKAALFLIPILGINYLLLPIRNCSLMMSQLKHT